MEKYSYTEKEFFIGGRENRIYCKAFVPGKAGERLPALILSHGYNSSHSDLTDAAEAAAECGFYACTYDFCGGGLRSMSGGSALDMTIPSEQKDLLDVIDRLSSEDCIDGSRIFLYGESQGGFVSALTAADIPGRIAGLLLLYPAFCIPDDWKRRAAEDPAEAFDFMGMTVSRKFSETLPGYDVYGHIGKFEKPVIIFHGDKDGIVPLSYAEKAASCYKNAVLHVFEGEGHGFSPAARKRLIEMIRDFLKER